MIIKLNLKFILKKLSDLYLINHSFHYKFFFKIENLYKYK